MNIGALKGDLRAHDANFWVGIDADERTERERRIGLDSDQLGLERGNCCLQTSHLFLQSLNFRAYVFVFRSCAHGHQGNKQTAVIQDPITFNPAMRLRLPSFPVSKLGFIALAVTLPLIAIVLATPTVAGLKSLSSIFDSGTCDSHNSGSATNLSKSFNLSADVRDPKEQILVLVRSFVCCPERRSNGVLRLMRRSSCAYCFFLFLSIAFRRRELSLIRLQIDCDHRLSGFLKNLYELLTRISGHTGVTPWLGPAGLIQMP
jgi:hypothetical protein